MAGLTEMAIQYPGWRVDITGPDTVVLTSVTGWRWVVTIRYRGHGYQDSPWIRLARRIASLLRRTARQVVDAAEWIVAAVIWMTGMWMVSIAVMMMALGVI